MGKGDTEEAMPWVVLRLCPDCAPHFAQQDARAPQPINARAETVASKPLFRSAL